MPGEHHPRIQLFFDAECQLCQSSVAWIRARDRRNRIEYVPITPATVKQAGLDVEACRQRMHIVTPAAVLAGWKAVCHLLRMFWSTWLFGVLGALPPFRWVGNYLYDRLARNRYGFGRCTGDSCNLV